MKEFVQLGGVRRWHGDEFVTIQKDMLDHLQAFFAETGNAIISGCAVYFFGGSYWLSEGYVGCKHIDGYKIAKVANVNLGPAGSFPFYISITKTAQTKVYDDLVARNSSNTYSAVIGNSVPAGDYIQLATTGGLTWKQQLFSNGGWQYVGSGGGTPNFQNGFTAGFGSAAALPRYRKDINIVWVMGAVDYSALSGFAFNTDVTIWNMPLGSRPDNELYQDIIVAYNGGDYATLRITCKTNGVVSVKCIVLAAGTTMSDLASGTPFGERFSLSYPV